MEHDKIDGQKWEKHLNDDALYGNESIDKDEYIASFEARVLREHPNFDRSVLDEFRRFFTLWEQELERIEQVNAQTAHKRLIRYLKS